MLQDHRSGQVSAALARDAVRLAQQAVAYASGQCIEEIAAPTRRSRHAALARQIAMYLAHVALGLNFVQIAGAAGRDRTTVAHACRVVEDRRDDPDFDALLDRLEAFLAGAADLRDQEAA